VHTHNLPGITTGIWEVSRRRGLPVVHTLHDYHLLCPRTSLMQPSGEPCRPSPLVCGFRSKRVTRWAGAVSHVVGVSRFVLAAHDGIFRHAELHLIRHPVVPLAMRPLRSPRTRLTNIGYIGLMHPNKGVRVLIAAAPSLAERGVTVSMAGVGRFREEVASAAARLPGLRYEGFVSGERKEAFFEDCDAGIVPSIWNEPGGPSYTAIEWLCAGRPVLVSDRGGLGEALDRFGGVIRVEPTVPAILATVDRLLGGGHWSEAVSSVAPVVAQGDTERWLEDYERVYEAALRPRSSVAPARVA
jgi:glycosyltransferase involved in cell wall biosynthesis